MEVYYMQIIKTDINPDSIISVLKDVNKNNKPCVVFVNVRTQDSFFSFRKDNNWAIT